MSLSIERTVRRNKDEGRRPYIIYLEYLAMKAESSKRARIMYIRTKKASTEFDADDHQAQETSQDTYKPNTEKSKARRISIKINRTSEDSRNLVVSHLVDFLSFGLEQHNKKEITRKRP